MSKKICFITTVSRTIDQFIRFSFEAFHNDGYEIHVIADMDDAFIKSLPDYVHPKPVKMGRGVHPRDLVSAISAMIKIFKKEKFDIIQYSTPNASFYASVAGWLTHIPVRLYCQWGLVYQSFSGIKRFIFKTLERITCKLSTDVQPDSHGNLELCRKMKFYTERKSRVVWNGSANGISLDKFNIENKEEYRRSIREAYHIDDNALVMGYVGRIGKEKGFEELVMAFKRLSERYNDAVLLYVGPNEKPDTVSKELLDYFYSCDKIIYTGGWVDDTERYYAAMDVFAFPTYHEGFGSVTIEAEAMGVPVVVSDVPGPQDAIIDGVTGFKVPAKNVEHLAEKISALFDDVNLRAKMGEAGRNFVVESFDDRILVAKILENRNHLLNKKVKTQQ